MAALSASHIALLVFAFSTIWARSVKDCEEEFKNCMNKDRRKLTDCGLELISCLRKYCDRRALSSITKKKFAILQSACYVEQGIFTLLP
ncbi:hypothetical protein ScPMuIL_009238 [Solemya velum]